MICEPIDIRCPDCGGLAKFEEPFEFVLSSEFHPDDGRSAHQWGGWVVLERFPTQFHWKPPAGSEQYLRGGGDARRGGYPLLTNGMVQCSRCYSDRKHRLNWPCDAYWQWGIRGEVLWAWGRKHANVILQYIKEANRGSQSVYGLRYIPANFLSAKVRDSVVTKMERSLGF